MPSARFQSFCIEMCGRTACSLNPECIKHAAAYVNKNTGKKMLPEWKDQNEAFKYKPRYNQAPTQLLPVLTSKKHFDSKASVHNRVVMPMSWGFVPVWHKGDRGSFKLTTVNCRSETIGSSKVFTPAFEKGQRCVLVCEGYFEWHRIPNDNVKKPYFIYFPQMHVDFKGPRDWKEGDLMKGGEWHGPRLLTIAGLFESNEHLNPGTVTYTFTALTTKAHKSVEWIHDRMPVILENEDVDKWLNYEEYQPKDVLDVLKPFGGLEYHEVSQTVNSVRNDDLTCVIPRKLVSAQPPNTLQKWLIKRPRDEQGTEVPKKQVKLSSNK